MADSTSEAADLDLLAAIIDQEESAKAVNDWLFDVELEDLASGKPRDVMVGGVAIKTPLSYIFGTSWRCCLGAMLTKSNSSIARTAVQQHVP